MLMFNALELAFVGFVVFGTILNPSPNVATVESCMIEIYQLLQEFLQRL